MQKIQGKETLQAQKLFRIATLLSLGLSPSYEIYGRPQLALSFSKFQQKYSLIFEVIFGKFGDQISQTYSLTNQQQQQQQFKGFQLASAIIQEPKQVQEEKLVLDYQSAQSHSFSTQINGKFLSSKYINYIKDLIEQTANEIDLTQVTNYMRQQIDHYTFSPNSYWQKGKSNGIFQLLDETTKDQLYSEVVGEIQAIVKTCKLSGELYNEQNSIEYYPQTGVFHSF